MPEAPNKFKKMMETAREHQAPALDTPPALPPDDPPIPQSRPTTPAVSKNRGRPATGKRSDPDYESTTVFLRKQTKTAAAHLLLNDRDQDLSDVLENLLSGWVSANS
jgi:hypothetical protein